jgi:glycolate oxidase iron-sulfur subunit
MQKGEVSVVDSQVLVQIDKCSKCGTCRSVCPVFAETNDELMVARGRLTLAEAIVRGELDYSGKYLRSLKSCIRCLRCVDACPSGVDVGEIVRSMRVEAARQLGLSPLTKLVFRRVLPNRRLYDVAIRFASFAQRLLPREREGPLRHLPLFFRGERSIPSLARRSFLERARQYEALEGAQRRVGLFVGCLINYVYPEVGDAVVRLLNRYGVDVVVPQDQVCCGAPVIGMGDDVAARTLAEKNIRAFRDAGVDTILVACATGGKTLKHDYPAMFGEEAAEFSSSVKDVVEFVQDLVPTVPGNVKVTYHDPCHLRWGQDIYREPREVLNRVAQYEEMPDADRCCGMGGTFSLFFHDLSRKIAGRKLDAIAATDADIVATACPGCMLQLNEGIAQRDIRKSVKHIVEIIEEASRNQGPHT